MDLELALEDSLVNMTEPPTTPTRPYAEPINTPSLPRSKRQPFEPTGNTDLTPKQARPPSGIPKPVITVEPLSIKKRNSVRTSPNPPRKSYAYNSPLAKSRVVSPRRVPQLRLQTPATASDKVQSYTSEDLDKLIYLAESTKSDVRILTRLLLRPD